MGAHDTPILVNTNVPLLNGQRCLLGQAKPHHLALGVEGIEVNVSDNTQRICGAKGRELREMTIGELGASIAVVAAMRRRGSSMLVERRRRGHHARFV